MNSHYRLPAGRTIKMEHATLSYEVPEGLVGQNLYVFVRALNFTDEDGANHINSDGCLALFMEIEYRANKTACNNDPQLLPNTGQITGLREESLTNSYITRQDFANHTVNDPRDTFFTY